MAISLTRKEFAERFEQREELFIMGLKKNAEELAPLRIVVPAGQTEVNIDLHETIFKIILMTTELMLDLVYDEDLN